jgi:hypothetical protein
MTTCLNMVASMTVRSSRCGRRGESSGPRGELEDFVFGDRPEPAAEFLAVGAQQDDRGLSRDLERTPRLERGVPQHRERLRAAFVDELECLVEAVLCAVTDDLDVIEVISSELLDVGSFPTAGGSMRRPRPQQYGSVGREDVGDVRLAVATDVVDNQVGERVAAEL